LKPKTAASTRFFIFDRINRIFRIFFPGFPEESLETPIAFGEKKNPANPVNPV